MRNHKSCKRGSVLLFLLSSGCLLLTACDKNPILKVDSNVFAKTVDVYCKAPTGWNYRPTMHICISYYYDQDDAKKMLPAAEIKRFTEQECPKEFKGLVGYLNKDPKFAGIKVEDLASKSVWTKYFNAKHEMSNYFRK